MNEKEISEIRRRFHPDKSNITHIRGCYVNEKKEIVSQFDQSVSLMPQEEAERMLKVLKRTLSGTYQKNLIDISFSTQQVVDSTEHKLLMSLRASALKEDESVNALFSNIIAADVLQGDYLILLAYDKYDVPYRSTDGEKQADASNEVFSYILCSVCPVKTTKPALSYHLYDNSFRTSQPEWLVGAPEVGFMFPAFDDRSANIYGALYYTKDCAENYQQLVDKIFCTEIPMPAEEQKEVFGMTMMQALDVDCSYEVVQAVQEQLCEMIETHKVNKEVEPLAIKKSDIGRMLQNSGVSQERFDQFSERFDSQFGADTELSPKNIVDTNQLEIKTPSVSIKVKPEYSNLVKTRTIDGAKYILIRVDEGVEVNGVSVQIN